MDWNQSATAERMARARPHGWVWSANLQRAAALANAPMPLNAMELTRQQVEGVVTAYESDIQNRMSLGQLDQIVMDEHATLRVLLADVIALEASQ